MPPLSEIFEIRELTRSKRAGDLYFRRDNVKDEIVSLQNMSSGEILKRVYIEQEEEENSLKSETIVFIYRRWLENRDHSELHGFEIATSTTLLKRIERILRPERSYFRNGSAKEDYQDFVQNVIVSFLGKFTKEDYADYGEVSFGQFIKGIAKNHLRKYLDGVALENKRIYEFENKFMLLSRDRSIGITRHLMVDMKDSVPSDQITPTLDQLASKINHVPDPMKTAWVLKNLADWKVESEDPDEVTIARYYKKSGRTIRDWISDAEQILKESVIAAD